MFERFLVPLADLLQDLFVLGMATRCLLRENEVPVDRDFVHTTTRGNEGERSDLVLELGQ
ncbi:MAG: hypothetical protein QOG16_873 [Actinomycetota bacterium]|jgi:hypothetical protein|nr:hypothetical protein [Actinomycetota bacterium]